MTQDTVMLLTLGGMLVGLIAAVRLASWWNKRTSVARPSQPEELMQYSKDLLAKSESQATTARAIQREKQGGLSEQSVRIMLDTLEQVSEDEGTELKFTGRAKKARANKGN